MTRIRMWVGLMALAAVACGDDDDGGGEKLAVCYEVCDAQEAAETAGNCPGLGVATCQALCDVATSADCSDELTAANECVLTGEFTCGWFSAESNADCSSEYAAYDACADVANGGDGGKCAGADEQGTCPLVDCPCPDGNERIRGTTTEAGSCACLDQTTCQDFCF